MVFTTDYSFENLTGIIEEIIQNVDYSIIKNLRWFRKKADKIKDIKIIDYGVIKSNNNELVVLLILDFKLFDDINGKEYNEIYYLPVIISKETGIERDILLKIIHKDYKAYVYDGIHTLSYNRVLEDFITKEGKLDMHAGGRLEARILDTNTITESSLLTDVSSNSLTYIKKEYIIKTYRRLMEGINPDLEIGLSLLEETNFRKFPRIKGYLSYITSCRKEYDLLLIEEFVPNQGDLWAYTQKHLENFFNYIKKTDGEKKVTEYISSFSREMTDLGRVIGEMHIALASIKKKEFIPREPTIDEISMWHSQMSTNVTIMFKHLKNNNHLYDKSNTILNKIISSKDIIYTLIDKIYELKDSLGKYIRVHGDLHLEQVLKRKGDYLVLDFEGEPLKELTERRRKYSPLKDVAGMLRSFNYAVYSFMLFNDKDDEYIKNAFETWEDSVVNSFLQGYTSKVRAEMDGLLPPENVFKKVLALFTLEKSIYEAIYEINNRPDWIKIPLQGIMKCVEELKKGD